MRAWLHIIDGYFPLRYGAWLAALLLALAFTISWLVSDVGGLGALVFAGLVGVGWRDAR